MTVTRTLKTASGKRGRGMRTGRRPNLVALGVIPLLVLVACLSTSATAATNGRTGSGISAPRSGYLVYWDQDEEVDYYESANHSQGQLMAPWDLNGQVCLLNDGTGRWVGGSDPTNESQHNPGGPADLSVQTAGDQRRAERCQRELHRQDALCPRSLPDGARASR